MATAPLFATTPRIGLSQITTANTARDGTGTLVTLFTAGTAGSRVDRVTVTATVTSALGSITLFISDGTNNRLYREIQVSAVTVSATVPAWVGQLAVSVVLPAGYSIKGATTVATGQPFNVTVEGADY